jgi:hypothetical protein
VLFSRYLIVSCLLLLVGLSTPMSAQDKDKAKDATGEGRPGGRRQGRTEVEVREG